MSKVLLDKNFNGRITQALVGRLPAWEFVHVDALGLGDASDEELLAHAAVEGQLVLSHDIKTFPSVIRTRMVEGKAVPRIVLVPARMSVGRAIDDIELALEVSQPSDWVAGFIRLPLR